MDKVLLIVITLTVVWAAGGFLGGLVLLGLSRSSDWLFKKTGLPLKYQALAPLMIILVLVGLFTSLMFIPYAILLFGIVILLLGLGRKYFFGRPVFRQLIGVNLLGAVTLSFVLIAQYAFGWAWGSDWNSFYIYNHSGHEIVLKEVLVDGQGIFRHGSDPDQEGILPPDTKTWGEHWDVEFSRWPEKITLRIYDTGLQQEVRGEVGLPKSKKQYVCGFHIVYKSEGFRYYDRPCH